MNANNKSIKITKALEDLYEEYREKRLTWRTKSREVLLIQNMETTHVVACIRQILTWELTPKNVGLVNVFTMELEKRTVEQ
tara:strand:+ start:539 stop:781 length:243 start_codon:yes stop_codon:yes gene_type:complete